MPYFSQTRLFDKKPSKLKWKLPQLGAAYEIEKVLFVGAENMISSYHASRVKDGISGWLAGNDDYSKPMVQDWPKMPQAAGSRPGTQESCCDRGDQESGLMFGCKLESWDNNSLEAQASADDQKALPAIELKPAAKPEDGK